MKKFLALLLAVLMVVGLFAACAKDSADAEPFLFVRECRWSGAGKSVLKRYLGGTCDECTIYCGLSG